MQTDLRPNSNLKTILNQNKGQKFTTIYSIFFSFSTFEEHTVVYTWTHSFLLLSLLFLGSCLSQNYTYNISLSNQNIWAKTICNKRKWVLCYMLQQRQAHKLFSWSEMLLCLVVLQYTSKWGTDVVAYTKILHLPIWRM